MNLHPSLLAFCKREAAIGRQVDAAVADIASALTTLDAIVESRRQEFHTELERVGDGNVHINLGDVDDGAEQLVKVRAVLRDLSAAFERFTDHEVEVDDDEEG